MARCSRPTAIESSEQCPRRSPSRCPRSSVDVTDSVPTMATSVPPDPDRDHHVGRARHVDAEAHRGEGGRLDDRGGDARGPRPAHPGLRPPVGRSGLGVLDRDRLDRRAAAQPHAIQGAPPRRAACRIRRRGTCHTESSFPRDCSAGIGRAIRLGRPPVNVSLGTGARFHMPLPALEAAEPSETTVELVLVPLEHGGGPSVIRGRVVGTPSGATFIGSGDVPRGRYRLVEPDGVVLPSSPTFRVGIGGRIRVQRSTAPWNRARVAAAIRRRLAAGRA